MIIDELAVTHSLLVASMDEVMIPTDEFYSLSEKEQKSIVAEGRVAADGEIASSIPDPDQNVRVFETPIEDKIVQTLQRGHFTIEELEAEFPLKKRVVDSIVSEMRYRPDRLLAKYHSIVRVADTEGPAFVYTIEPLPYKIRVWDPTLFGYLLQQNDSVPIPDWKSERKSWDPARETYVNRLEDYWDLPDSELPEKPYYELSFASSTLGPLPKSTPEDDLSVRERLCDVEAAYRRKKYDKNSIEHRIAYHKSACRRNPSLATFQSFALYLHDLAEYIDTQGHPEFRSLLEGGTKLFFACLFGGYRLRKDTEWTRFEVDRIGSLEETDERVIDIVELQPTSNSELAERWGLPDGSAAFRVLDRKLDRYATRNTDNYVCATESARRYIKNLETQGKVELGKEPPVVPNQAKTVLNV